MIEPGTKITDENQEEAERESREEKERADKSLLSLEFISSLINLVCETNKDAHRAMKFAIVALIVAVLALFV